MYIGAALWWAQVTVIPEVNKIAVFSKGIWNGVIPIGGQTAPSSIEVDKLLWKKAQKNETKNKTSDKINRIIPHRNPVVTELQCEDLEMFLLEIHLVIIGKQLE